MDELYVSEFYVRKAVTYEKKSNYTVNPHVLIISVQHFLHPISYLHTFQNFQV